jgi:hypothetical protein
MLSPLLAVRKCSYLALFLLSQNVLNNLSPPLSDSHLCRAANSFSNLVKTVFSVTPLIVTTTDNATVPAGHGITAWADAAAVEVSNPNLQLEPGTTNGTFARLFDLDTFAADGKPTSGVCIMSENRSQ